MYKNDRRIDMTNLLKSDFMKVKYSKSFWICLAYIILSVCLRAFLDRFGMSALPGADMVGSVSVTTSNTLFDSLMDAAGNNISTVLPIVIPMFICNEFIYGSYVNIVSKGINRKSLFLSKAILSWIITGIYFGITLFLYSLITSLTSGIGQLEIHDFIKMIFVLLTQLLAFEAMCTVIVFISFASKNAVIAIPASFCILRFLPPALDMVSHLKDNQYMHIASDVQVQHLIDIMCNSEVSIADTRFSFIVAVLYLLIFAMLSCLIFRNTDIK